MELSDKIDAILQLQNIDKKNIDDVSNNLRHLRNMCAKGSDIQLAIASNLRLQAFLKDLLFTKKANEGDSEIKQVKTLGWQLLANSTVNNSETQSIIWQTHGEQILQEWFEIQKPLEQTTDIMLMIMYNVMKSRSTKVPLELSTVFRAVVCIWQSIIEQKCSFRFEYLHFIFEDFLVTDVRNTVKCYTQLKTMEKLAFLDYLVNYLRQGSPNGLVHSFILQHISKDFKMKSDCILRVLSMEEIDKTKPEEVYELLRCIASASGSEHYSQLYATDHALFLNVSSLLRCLVSAGKSSKQNIFTPMNRLEQVAPSSSISAEYQTEISYELKTLLVRCIANLLYNNKTNKGYCLDTQLMPVLFECTNMDARNPLMKEWSILAIRNACVECPEIQQVIASLTKQGQAQNDILTELNLDMGSLRINPSSG